MLKIKLKAKARQSIHCGSDLKTGNIKLNARTPVFSSVKEIKSLFNDNDRRLATTLLLVEIWNAIPAEVRADRGKTINDEFFNAVSACSYSRSIPDFIQSMGHKFSINAISSKRILDLVELLNDEEVMYLIRYEMLYLSILFKSVRDRLKSGEIIKITPSESPTSINISYNNIPYVSGNSVRHKIRDLSMKFYFDFIGKDNFTTQGYYEFFGGGNLSSSSGKIDCKKQNDLIANCPPLGLMGTAKANMTIEGALKVSHMMPLCKELGNGELSYWELMQLTFGTRSDIARKPSKYKLLGGKEVKAPQQMLYWNEGFKIGTEFNLLGQKIDLFFNAIKAGSNKLFKTSFDVAPIETLE